MFDRSVAGNLSRSCTSLYRHLGRCCRTPENHPKLNERTDSEMLSNGIGLTGLTLYFLISRENAMYDIGFTFWRSGASQKCGCPSDHRLLAAFGSVKIHGFQIVFQSAKVSNQWIQWQVFNLFGAQSLFMFHIHYWLVVWSMSYDFPFSWECHHPNWLSLHHFSEGWAQPPTSYLPWSRRGWFDHIYLLRTDRQYLGISIRWWIWMWSFTSCGLYSRIYGPDRNLSIFTQRNFFEIDIHQTNH